MRSIATCVRNGNPADPASPPPGSRTGDDSNRRIPRFPPSRDSPSVRADPNSRSSIPFSSRPVTFRMWATRCRKTPRHESAGISVLV